MNSILYSHVQCAGNRQRRGLNSKLQQPESVWCCLLFNFFYLFFLSSFIFISIYSSPLLAVAVIVTGYSYFPYSIVVDYPYAHRFSQKHSYCIVDLCTNTHTIELSCRSIIFYSWHFILYLIFCSFFSWSTEYVSIIFNLNCVWHMHTRERWRDSFSLFSFDRIAVASVRPEQILL